MILVPVKNISGAKQRLAPVLDAEERAWLAFAMLEDVLGALAACTARLPVSVVTADPSARDLARGFHFEIIEDPSNQGETDAIAMATRVCESRDAVSTLVLPADIPLVQPSELEEIYAAAPPEGSVLVPARDGRGTNAALRRPAALFPLRFGNDSFLPHLAAARATGRPCVTLRLAGIGLDVDTPADLAELLVRPGTTRAQRLLRSWRLVERLSPAPSR